MFYSQDLELVTSLSGHCVHMDMSTLEKSVLHLRSVRDLEACLEVHPMILGIKAISPALA